MEDAVGILFLIGIAGLVAWRLFVKWQREQREQEERRRKREEQKRLEGCGQVVRFFHNNMGYIAKECITRDELEAKIDKGFTGGELAEEIMERVAEKDGIVLGYHAFDFGDGQATRVDVKLTLPNRERHTYIIGKTGSGKTNLLRNLILQDIQRGDGIGVIAPEQEMITEEILPYIPDYRMDDVVYFNPADTERPVTFNPLHVDKGEDIDLRQDEIFTIFQRLTDGGGPRMNEILRHSLYALLKRPGTTLLDIPRLLDRNDPSFREEIIRTAPAQDTAYFFENTYPTFPKDAHLPIVTRLGQLLQPRFVRNVLCHPESALNFRQAMDTGKILLFNLSDGILGETNSRILGQLIVSKIQLTTMSRADVAKEKRRPFWLYLDEFQSFVDVNATSYETLLSRARKYRLGLILAHQNTAQIPSTLLREIFGNVAAMIGFVVSHEDATKLSREFVVDFDGEIDHVPPETLVSLKVGEAVCKIGRSTFFMKTYLADQHPDRERAEEILERSRRNYGVKPVRWDTEDAYRPTAAGAAVEDVQKTAFKDFDAKDW